jgi:murein DD-endopeptidase MepM/ murein hydrolase activator NlpD
VSATDGGALEAVPSAFARRTFGAEPLAEYRSVGAELGIDWPILAAADKVEGGPAGAGGARQTRNRALAIAYSLQTLGAAADYETALAERSGTGYARRVLALAQQLQGTAGVPAAPVAELPLETPAEGAVIAAYGQRFGVLHNGIDIDARTGAPVEAAAAGVVVSTDDHPIFGLLSCVAHRLGGQDRPRELTTCYGNQSSFLVAPGDVVRAGELIGRAGCTGTCLRPHVHFQVRLGGDGSAPTVDPAPYLSTALAEQAQTAGRPLERP